MGCVSARRRGYRRVVVPSPPQLLKDVGRWPSVSQRVNVLYVVQEQRTGTKVDIHASLPRQKLNLSFPTPLEGGSYVNRLRANESADSFKADQSATATSYEGKRVRPALTLLIEEEEEGLFHPHKKFNHDGQIV